MQVIEAPEPVKVPDDAILLPYDSESKTGIQDASRLLVPYAKYVELWNLAHPDKKLEAKAPPAPYALAGASYTATLEGEDYLVAAGHLEIQVFAEGYVSVPLALGGGVLAKAELDGKPARMNVVQPEQARQGNSAGPPGQAPANSPPGPQQASNPAANSPLNPATSNSAAYNAAPARPFAPEQSMVLLYVSGKGPHSLEVSVRLKLQRRGGWRVVEGTLPSAVASAIAIVVPQPQTEVRLTEVPDRRSYETQVAGQKIETALSPAGTIGIQWRPKVAEGQVDRSLTAQSDAVLDVQEDGLRLFWQANLEFRRSQRDTFRVEAPVEYLLEKVEGGNVRGWEIRKEEKRQIVEITLLKTAKDSERFALRLWRPGAVGEAGLTEFEAPVVKVADAAMQGGRIVIRRSPLLDVRTVSQTGLSRSELPAAGSPQAPAARAQRTAPWASVPTRHTSLSARLLRSAWPPPPWRAAQRQTFRPCSASPNTSRSWRAG